MCSGAWNGVAFLYLSATATIGLEVLNLLEAYSIQLTLFMPEQLKSVFEFSPSSENTKIGAFVWKTSREETGVVQQFVGNTTPEQQLMSLLLLAT